MKILIYDDCRKDVDVLIERINEFAKIQEIEFCIDLCNDSKYLYENINKYDLLFLDIEINEENGIDIGTKVATIPHDCRIIITSNYKKYLIEGYRINADRYFLKPISKIEFNLEMENIINQYFKKQQGFRDSKISQNKIYYKDILYIDVYDRKTRIHFINGRVKETNYFLKDWLNKLDAQIFFQIHKSFVLNLNYISEFSKKDIYLMDGTCLPLSRNYKNDFEKKYIQTISRLI